MTVQCIDCSQWRPRETDKKLAALSLAICKLRSITPGHTFSGIRPHECEKFDPAPADVAAARRAFEGRARP